MGIEANRGTLVHQEDNILEVSHLKKYFPIKGGFFGGVTGTVKAVDDVSFQIKRGIRLREVYNGADDSASAGKDFRNRSV